MNKTPAIYPLTLESKTNKSLYNLPCLQTGLFAHMFGPEPEDYISSAGGTTLTVQRNIR
jgi:hypothetical protein